jgi:hypothetical protein
MLTHTDLISLPFTSDLTIGGIALACRSLSKAYEPKTGSQLDHIRSIISSVAGELAFRRLLGEQSIPYHVVNPTTFSDLDQYEVCLAGHRCTLVSTLLTRRQHIARIRRDPGLLLQEPAFIPPDNYNPEGKKYEDIYLFAYILGLVASSHADEDRAKKAGQPVYLLHAMPEKWAHPDGWVALKQLALKSDCDQAITIEMGGKDHEHNFISRTIELPSRRRVQVPEEWFSIAYIHAPTRPEARIGMHSPVRGVPHIIRSYDWFNIWLYGMAIYLAGWITHDNFRRKSQILHPGMPGSSLLRPPAKSLGVSTSDLEPLAPLLTSVQAWESEKLV